jgi:hypothetical protein
MRNLTHRLTYLALLAFAVCFSSCLNDLGPVDPVTNLIPLAPGNRWDFVRSYFDSLGNVTSTSPDSMYFRGDTLVGGIRWSYGFGLTAKLGFRNTPRGLMIRLLMETRTPGEFLRYLCPATLDYKYGYPSVWSDASIEDTTWTIRLLARDISVTVPAGTFKCLQYRVEHKVVTNPLDAGYWDDFISTDYGWIRQVMYGRRVLGGGIFPANRMDLQSLHLR